MCLPLVISLTSSTTSFHIAKCMLVLLAVASVIFLLFLTPGIGLRTDCSLCLEIIFRMYFYDSFSHLPQVFIRDLTLKFATLPTQHFFPFYLTIYIVT